jgi:hypothetical protein
MGSSGLMAQNDTIVLKNKDRLIGEVKKMENGVLTIETDYSDDDFTLTWIDVRTISSEQNYLITLSGGRRLTSNLGKGDSLGMVHLNDEALPLTVRIDDIVYVKPVENSFLSRLDASISFGYNFTKSNNLAQLTARSSFAYTANFFTLSGSYNSVRSNQDNVDEIQRTDADIGMKYFLKKDRFVSVLSEFLSNDEQKLALRVTTKGGMGRYFVHTNHLYFGGGAGIAWNNERFFESTEGTRNSVEAFGSLEANLFDLKDFSLLTNLTIYPSLTEKKRIRSDFKLDLKYDLPLDFFIKLGTTFNYDNKPIDDASQLDYVIQTTFGWEL